MNLDSESMTLLNGLGNCDRLAHSIGHSETLGKPAFPTYVDNTETQTIYLAKYLTPNDDGVR